MKGERGPDRTDGKSDRADEPWVEAVRQEVRRVCAPESLRARIEAMLAVERQRVRHGN